MKHRTNQLFQQKESMRDLIIIVIIAIIGFAMEMIWDFVPPLLDSVRNNDSLHLTEVLLVFFILLCGFGIFYFRRYRCERRNAERYRNTYNMMKDGMCLSFIINDGPNNHKDFRFFEMNPACERMLGLHRDEVLGRKISDISGSFRPIYTQAYEKVASSGNPFSFHTYD
ncbi:MAG: PAS domain-containing protein, partial [Candidatus Thermoplasmatota archaeon]|nr:PAS domain-containing protein [Candidatus Thermoplasmatota archaeon]